MSYKKNNIDFQETASYLLPFIESILITELPGGKREGSEWVVLNPKRADQRPGSFKINLSTGVWSDFATNDGGGDIISLYAYLHDVSQLEAAKVLQECYLGVNQVKTNTKKKQNRWVPVLPVPHDVAAPPKAHLHYGLYSNCWKYLNDMGRLLGYTCRFDRKDKAKEILPLTYCENQKGKREWRWRSFDLPRPLYGLERLAVKPDLKVLIVEGEKCADVGAKQLGEMAVISWIGGSKAVKRVDFSPLKDRDVILWPDRDRTGYLAMLDICDKIKDIAASITIIRPPEGKPKGWDIADAVNDGWDGVKIRMHIAQNHMDPEACRRIHIGQRDEKIMFDAGGNGSSKFNLTDTGNALRLVKSYGHLIRYNDDPFGKWFWWNGKLWSEDKTKKIYSYVDKVIADICREASESDSDRRKKLSQWAFKLESMNRQRAMVAKMETLQDIVVLIDDFDRNQYLFNTTNCTLDLSSGEPVPRDHNQLNYITKMAGTGYDPEAVCSKWEQFLGEIFDNNEELIVFIKRAIGYTLTGNVNEQCLFFAYGTGQNGKTVFFNTIEMLFGDYWGKAPTDMIIQQKFTQVPTDVADLKGKRFVVCSEVDDNRRFSESRVKDITGGDAIVARRMRENFFSFKPTHKLWIYGNHKPAIYGTDKGIWRRIKIIPFTVMIPDEKKRPMGQILQEFKSELSGILNWALQGYMEYSEKGFNEPKAVTSAIDEYREEMNIIGRFIKECCIENGNKSIHATKLWQAYHGWCDDNGEHAFSSRRFNTKLREIGYAVRSGAHNKTTVFGLVLTIDVRQDEMNI